MTNHHKDPSLPPSLQDARRKYLSTVWANRRGGTQLFGTMINVTTAALSLAIIALWLQGKPVPDAAKALLLVSVWFAFILAIPMTMITAIFRAVPWPWHKQALSHLTDGLMLLACIALSAEVSGVAQALQWMMCAVCLQIGNNTDPSLYLPKEKPEPDHPYLPEVPSNVLDN